MAYFRTCQFCGSNLDPGETCDCQKKEGPKRIFTWQELETLMNQKYVDDRKKRKKGA